MNRFILSRYRDLTISMLVSEEGRTLRIWADRPDSSREVPGMLYLARVTKIVPSIHAAFAEYLPGRTGYLPLEKTRCPHYIKKGSSPNLQQSDELIVQIDHEVPGDKRTALSADLCLAGQYAVLDAVSKSKGVSKKIRPARREQLKAFLENRDSDYGIILRTNAEDASETVLDEEIAALEERFRDIFRKAQHAPCPVCLMQDAPAYLARLKDLQVSSTEKIITDDPAICREISEYLQSVSSPLSGEVSEWKDDLWTLWQQYSMEKRLREALQKKVWLKSGAFLVIEQTEALVSIDVNSGKSSPAGPKDKERAILRVNLEAAKEIAAQLILRNLSGMILIDFINMELNESKERLLLALQEFLKDDPCQAQALGFTRLNLVEMVRRRSGLSLEQSLTGEEKHELLAGL